MGNSWEHKHEQRAASACIKSTTYDIRRITFLTLGMFQVPGTVPGTRSIKYRIYSIGCSRPTGAGYSSSLLQSSAAFVGLYYIISPVLELTVGVEI